MLAALTDLPEGFPRGEDRVKEALIWWSGFSSKLMMWWGQRGLRIFRFFSPCPRVHSHGGCQEAKLLLNWWSVAMSLLSDSGENNQKTRETACCSRRNMGLKQPTCLGLNPGFTYLLIFLFILAVWVCRIYLTSLNLFFLNNMYFIIVTRGPEITTVKHSV